MIALDALAAEAARLDVLKDIPRQPYAALQEQGVLDRIYVDTIENLVGTVETLASPTFAMARADAEALKSGRGNVFQRLEDTADLFGAYCNTDLRAKLGSDWWELRVIWATRHAFTHNDGIVDARYLQTVPATAKRLGQRLRVTERDARSAIDKTARLCRTISRVAPE